MDQITRWKKFIESPHSNKDEIEDAAILVILHKCIQPQPVFSKLSFGGKLTKAEWEELGYAFDESGELIHEGRVFLSREMIKVRDWCNDNDIQYSFYPKMDGPFMEYIKKKGRTFLQFNGTTTKENIESFPIEYEHFYVTIE